jgi:hypothetical protein
MQGTGDSVISFGILQVSGCKSSCEVEVLANAAGIFDACGSTQKRTFTDFLTLRTKLTRRSPSAQQLWGDGPKMAWITVLVRVGWCEQGMVRHSKQHAHNCSSNVTFRVLCVAETATVYDTFHTMT